MKSKSLILLAAFILLFIAGLVEAFYPVHDDFPNRVAKETASRVDHELSKIDEEAKLILKRFSAESKIQISYHSQFGFFVYDQNGLISWSNNAFVPAIQTVQDSFRIKLIKNATGDYLVKKWPLTTGRFLIAVLPLYSKFAIQNNYLAPRWNEKIFPFGNVIISEAMGDVGTPVYVQGKCIFRIGFFYNYPFTIHKQWVTVCLFFLSALCFVSMVYSFLPIVKRRGIDVGFVFLTCTLIPLRILMVELNFPNVFINTVLFDPKNFASSSYNASFGDLLLNELVVLALCYYLFKNYSHFRIRRIVFKHQMKGAVVLILSVMCVLFSVLYPYVVTQTLLNNSSVTLDISQSLHFDVLRIAALLALLFSWISSFLFAHVFIRLPFTKKRLYYFVICISIGIMFFVLINLYSHQVYLPSLIIGATYFVLVYTLKLYNELNKFSYATFLYLFVWIACMSINGAYAINRLTEKKKVADQFRFATNFLVDRDYFSEYLLHETAIKIANDQFVTLRMASPFLGKDIVRQKIRQKFLPSYFNKYNVYIKLFHSNGESYDNNGDLSFAEIINLYDKDAFRTEYKDIYFINSPSEDVSQKYLVIVPVKRFNITTNYIVIELSLKKIIPENVYPELLVDNRFQQFYKTQDVSYAVFSNKNVIFSSGEFNYEGLFDRRLLGKVELYTKGINVSGYIHIAQEDEIGRAAVVSSKLSSISYMIANFSFLLVLGLAIVLILFLILGVLTYLKDQKLFFSARIQLILNLAFFLPLIIACFTTLRLTSLSSQDQLNEEYLSKARNFGGQIAGILDSYLKSTNENKVQFENQLADLANLSNLDANVFKPNGTLEASSQPLIFDYGLFSTWMNPHALARIRSGENLFIEQDHTGKLEYFVSYAALKSSQTGNLIGILAVPFFQSGHSFDKVQITIFTNILNIFAGIFIVLLLLSYLVSEWLTFPLKFITQSLRKTSLTKTNQPLTWNANDEIGLMVKEYNQMLFKLGESKAELEQNQREKTWREVAQQVAHEIKNPLTPMKLTLQQMERSMRAGTSSTEKTEKALTSLLLQVDALNDIASSFSSFAKMPQPVIQKVALVTLVRQVAELHSLSGKFMIKKHEDEIVVQGDEQLLSRTFSNIILNAFQAARPNVPTVLEIEFKRKNGKGIVAFKDNGTGIDSVHADQIFIPHFSTKKSGSGLGLAIAKQGIEQIGGRIWFETTVGKGTTFYVELMLSA